MEILNFDIHRSNAYPGSRTPAKFRETLNARSNSRRLSPLMKKGDSKRLQALTSCVSRYSLNSKFIKILLTTARYPLEVGGPREKVTGKRRTVRWPEKPGAGSPAATIRRARELYLPARAGRPTAVQHLSCSILKLQLEGEGMAIFQATNQPTIFSI